MTERISTVVNNLGWVKPAGLRAGPAPEAPAGADPAMRLRLRDDSTPAAPDCASCHGTGGYRLDLPTWHARFGRLFECECVAANRAAGIGVTYRGGSGLLAGELVYGWGDLQGTEALTPAAAAVRRVLARGWGWVYLGGDYGTGKSRLLKTAVAETLRAGHGATYALQAEMLRHLRGGFDTGTYDERLEAWRAARVLAIDEMGRANETGWSMEVQSLIFGPRYDLALVEHAGVTIYASNWTAANMPEWLASRLGDNRFEVVEVRGPDMRPLMEED